MRISEGVKRLTTLSTILSNHPLRIHLYQYDIAACTFFNPPFGLLKIPRDNKNAKNSYTLSFTVHMLCMLKEVRIYSIISIPTLLSRHYYPVSYNVFRIFQLIHKDCWNNRVIMIIKRKTIAVHRQNYRIIGFYL